MSALQKAFDARSNKENKIEATKKLKSPLEAYKQLEVYAEQGYDAIPEEDLDYFFKCFGIYDRPKTPKQFMLRVRISGGQLSYEQAMVLGEVARDFGNDYVDITTRQQIELRYLDIENIPTLIKKLGEAGISTYQTGVDNFRNILNDPLDDLAFDNVLPSQELLLKLQSIFLHNPEWISALPRKFNTGITGSHSNRSNVFGQDCGLALAQKDGVYGYNLYLGGKVGRIAQCADMFLKDEAEVFAMFNTLIALFRDFGFRDNRNKNRLFFLLEAVGMEAMRRSICSHAGIEFARAGELMTQLDFNDPDQGRVKLKDGTFALHVSVPSGVFSGTALIEAAEISQQYGNGGIRLDVEQSLYMMGLSETSIESALKRDFFKTYKSVNTPYFNHLIACAGSEHCPFGVIPNKPDAIEMAQYLSQAVPLEQGRVRMYWSGCIKGCGLHGIGDVGFEGCKAKLGGENVFGVHISLGGKITLSGEEGYSVIKAAPLSYAKYYVESLMLEYRRLKKPQESFEKFHDRVLAYYSSAAIGFMMKLKAYLRHKNIALDVGFDLHVKSAGVEEFEVFELGRKLYRALIGSEPYSAYGAFAPLIKERLQEPILTDSSVDANLSVMLVKMLRSSEEQARCFSELEPFIALYK